MKLKKKESKIIRKDEYGIPIIVDGDYSSGLSDSEFNVPLHSLKPD
jgi:hypothetical protein